MEKVKINIYKALYGALFVIVIPSLLILWAKQTESVIKLPVINEVIVGYILFPVGILMILAGMLHLWILGKGLPMNAFPPERYVTRGIYPLIKHPIYAGAGLSGFGLSVIFHSSSGFWLVSPMFTIMIVAYVTGFENEKTKQVFGEQNFRTIISLPESDKGSPLVKDRLNAYFFVFVPVIIICSAILFQDTKNYNLYKIDLSGNILPMHILLNAFYLVTLLAALLAPLLIKSKEKLRRFITGTWVTLILTVLITFSIPGSSSLFIPILAFISAIHFISGLKLYRIIWDFIRMQSERLANSWKEWRWGPVRLINHGFYGGAAGLAGTLIAGFFLGRHDSVIGFTVMIFVIIGAGLWAQLIEGSPRLLRPYGYYGGLTGGIIACIVASIIFSINFYNLVASFAMAAPWIQATGRLRCLVQGCCHGKQSDPEIGIRFTHPCSRVNKISGLNGIHLHPTQLYSIACNLVTGIILIKLYTFDMPSVFIIGIYLIMNGLGRFVEESFRGEAQTPYWAGMRIYQWIALINVFIGIVFTSIHNYSRIIFQFNLQSVFLALIMGIIVMIASGVDFPRSDRRFARLTSN